MNERLGRILAQAIQTGRPVLVNPTEEEIRAAAENLRTEGKLICTVCREPIHEETFRTQRLSFGSQMDAVAHLHAACYTEASETFVQ